MKSLLPVEELSKTAKRVTALAKNMNESFSDDHSETHMEIAIMAGLADMYRKGYSDGYSTGANGFKKD